MSRRAACTRPAERPPGAERGAAVLIALLAMLLLAGLASAVVTVTRTETLISTSHRRAQEALYAADAALQRTLLDLASMPDWTPLLIDPPANVTSTFDDARPVNVAVATAGRQRESDLVYPPAFYGGNTPIWRLFAHSSLGGLLPAGTLAQPADILVFVADDGEDGDGNARADSNERLLIVAEGRGTAGGRRQIEALVARTAAGTVNILAWKDAR